jgi:hypothetical protein
MLIDECRKEAGVKSSGSPKSGAKAWTARPGSFLSNFDDILSKNDWALPETSFYDAESQKTNSGGDLIFKLLEKKEDENRPVRFTLDDNDRTLTDKDLVKASDQNTTTASASLPLFTPHHDANSTAQNRQFGSQQQYSDVSFESLEQSKSMLHQLFPNICEEIILDFLLKYENDIDTVTNILLDSVDMNDSDSLALSQVQETPAPPPPTPVVVAPKIEETKRPESARRTVKSLQEICLDVMDRLERSLEQHFNKKSHSESNDGKVNNGAADFEEKSFGAKSSSSKKNNNKSKDKRNSEKRSPPGGKKAPQKAQENKTRDNFKAKLVDYDDFDDELNSSKSSSAYDNRSVSAETVDDDNKYEEEPILDLNLNKHILVSLIELFGEKADMLFLGKAIYKTLVIHFIQNKTAFLYY